MLSYIKSVTGTLNRYIDLGFLLKFVGLFLALYYTNIFFVQLTLPGKWYSPFFAEHFNYISWLTSSLTHTANIITQAFGLDTSVVDDNILAANHGHRVVVKWECLGLGIFSFWLAFVMAQSLPTRKKILLALGGIIGIWLLNCIRIGLLLVALEKDLKAWKQSWRFIGKVNHHDLFNYACYTFILLMILVYYRVSRRKKQAAMGNQQ
ncbi:MAG: hypothetical protein QM802_25540 [Agriterribacter sp.]